MQAVANRGHAKPASYTAQRRRRAAILLGGIIMLTLAGLGLVLVRQYTVGVRTDAVLRASSDIQAGTVITADELAVTRIHVDDQAVLATLAREADRNALVGQVASENVRAGSLIPAGLGVSSTDAGTWDVPVPVKRMPADLHVGDHVALVISQPSKTGTEMTTVAMQDVLVRNVQGGSVTLALSPKAVAQVEFWADNGGLILVRMPAGTAQPSLPSGGSP